MELHKDCSETWREDSDEKRSEIWNETLVFIDELNVRLATVESSREIKIKLSNKLDTFQNIIRKGLKS